MLCNEKDIFIYKKIYDAFNSVEEETQDMKYFDWYSYMKNNTLRVLFETLMLKKCYHE